MLMLDFCVNRIQTDGWLSISSLFFDNGYSVNVYNQRGYCAYSASNGMFVINNCMDTINSAIVENRFCIIKDNKVSLQQSLAFVDAEMLQHFSAALYAHGGIYYDEQKKTPYPKIPKEADLDKLVEDPETGLYTGTDTVVMMSTREHSTIPLYDDFKDDTKIPYSGAVIREWKMWYNNHKKFLNMLKEAYGISDAI